MLLCIQSLGYYNFDITRGYIHSQIARVGTHTLHLLLNAKGYFYDRGWDAAIPETSYPFGSFYDVYSLGTL